VPTKTINLSIEDLASVRRVLSHLDDGGDQPLQPPADGDRLREIAARMLELRRSRTEFLNRALLGEPAYEMLLRVYVAPEPLTAARLADLTGVPHSSALRWIEYLASKELVTRGRHPKDRRATVIGLTPKGKETLDALLRMIEEAVIWKPIEKGDLLG
jgi:DNA-binding MarR family transcriptional regulator